MPARRHLAGWGVLAGGTVLGSLALGALSIPSPSLLAAMLAGIAWALVRGDRPLVVPRPVLLGSEATVGVAIGAYVTWGTVEALGADLPAVLAVNVVTLALTIQAGRVLAARTGLDGPTAAFGMVAGGATGIVAISRELGADQRLVAVMQYLRVLVIVAITPPLAAFAFGADGRPQEDAHPLTAAGLAFLVVAVAGGIALARGTRMPAGTVLGPMLVASAVSIAGLAPDEGVPTVVQDVTFAVIGVAVGLRFTPQSLRQAGRILLPALGLIAALLVACFGVAVVLAAVTDATLLDAYLATTPGGLYAVLAVAVGGGADTAFVLTTQVLRLVVMLLVAPVLARRLAAGG